MHQAVLIACLPLLIALAVSFVLLALLLKFCARRVSAKAVWRRLCRLHSCQEGAVQSLSFVLTVPFFVVICLFIVQVSQLMIGVMVVHYAAYASARSAVVWIPAVVDDLDQNKLSPPPPTTAITPVVLTGDGFLVRENFKFRKIFEAAALGCGPISPSRDLGYQTDDLSGEAAYVMTELFESLAPETTENSRIPERIENKLAYSFLNYCGPAGVSRQEFLPGADLQSPRSRARSCKRGSCPRCLRRRGAVLGSQRSRLGGSRESCRHARVGAFAGAGPRAGEIPDPQRQPA